MKVHIKPFSEIEPEVEGIYQALQELGKIWLKQAKKYKLNPNSDCLKKWDNLIDGWAEDKDMPLFIRTSKKDVHRGVVQDHTSGRKFIWGWPR